MPHQELSTRKQSALTVDKTSVISAPKSNPVMNIRSLRPSKPLHIQPDKSNPSDLTDTFVSLQKKSSQQSKALKIENKQ